MSLNYSSLSQSQLRNLYHTTGAILFIDVPEGLEFGIDNILWKVGQKFKGIKFIPFGPHIISYTLKQENNQFKINKFIFLDQSKNSQTQILIFKWSPKYTMFLQLKGSQAQGYRQGVRKYHFDSYLGPYPSENVQFWKQNACFISRGVIEKLQPVQKIYKFQQEYNKIKEKSGQQVRIDVDDEDQEEEIIEEKQDINGQFMKDEQLNMKEQKNIDNQRQDNSNQVSPHKQGISKKFQPLSDTIYYSEIPRLLTNDPSHINKVNLNKTLILLQIIHKEYLTHSLFQNHHGPQKLNQNKKQNESKMLSLLGQLQYSFIYFLIGQDEESFQQWKKLVNLLVFSEDIFESKQSIEMKKEELSEGKSEFKLIIETFEQLALQFIVVLYNQLRQFPNDFFIDELSKNNFMQTCLKRLKQYSRQQEGMISKKVKKRLQKLFNLLSNKFNYELKQDDQFYDEDAPVVIQQNQVYF